VNLTLRDDRDLLRKLSARLAALCATNDLLLQSAWRSASLHDILTSEFAPYGLGRVRLEGEEVRCSSELAIVLTLVVHELTTNAAKYGALSSTEGRIDVRWSAPGGRLKLEWIESGLSGLVEPKREGFGTKLLRSGLRKFDGHVETRFRSEGFGCKISLEMAGPLPGNEAPSSTGHAPLRPSATPYESVPSAPLQRNA
jgi:two-component sensor histidine kinase